MDKKFLKQTKAMMDFDNEGNLSIVKKQLEHDEILEEVKDTLVSLDTKIEESISAISEELKKKFEEELVYEIDKDTIKGDSPTEEELLGLIKPLIPEVKDGYTPIKDKDYFDGKDYILTDKDKKDIAKKIEVPIVEKIIVEKTEVIKEQPLITEITKEVAVSDTPIVIAEKLNTLEREVDWKVLKNVPYDVVNGKNVMRGGGATKFSELTDHPGLQEVTDNGKTTTNTIEVAGLDVGTSTHVAVEGEAYFEDTNIILDGGTLSTVGETGFYKADGTIDDNTYVLSGTALLLDQTTPQTTVGTFTFPNVKVSGLTSGRIPFASTAGLLVDSTRLTMTTDGLMTLTGTTVTDGLVNIGKFTVSPINGTGAQVGSAISLTAGDGGLSPTITGSTGGGFTLVAGKGGGNSQGTGANITGSTGGAITITAGKGGDQNSTAFVGSFGGSGGDINTTTGEGGRAIGAGGAMGQAGGRGGDYKVLMGNGGIAEAGKMGGVGGSGLFNAGTGGASVGVSSATNTGGQGGSFTFNGGLGGQTLNSTTSNLGGKGGSLNFKGGPGGQALSIGRVGDGGDLIFQGGQTGTSTTGIPVAASTAGKLSFTSGLAASTGAWGNHAGLLEFISSPGSTAIRAGVANVGGNGGAFTFTSGDGGAASTGTSNTGGNAGDMTFTMGVGGVGATANGLNANMIFKSGSTEIARFSNTAGAVGVFKTLSGRIAKVTTVTDTYTVLATDSTVVCNKATAFTVTLPTAVVGQIFTIKNINIGAVTVDGAGSDVIDGFTTQTLNQWDSLTIQCSSANTWIII